MRIRTIRDSKILYAAFCIPFILAFASWWLFPPFAQRLIEIVFSYHVIEPVNSLWYVVVSFFYSWYTFLAIGVAGTWVIAATLVRLKHVRVRPAHYPMVSFVVPACEEEESVFHCITSLFKCSYDYPGSCEIIVVDDGSTDNTYEVAWMAIEANRRTYPNVRGKVIRHSVNIGKIEAIRTGVDKALGSLIAVVDADSWWMSDTLGELVVSMLSNGTKAVTGYANPTDRDREFNPYVILQQLEYSQGLGMNRCAQSLVGSVLVVPGAIGIYDAALLRKILHEKSICTVTEDLEITLEMHKREGRIGYVSLAKSSTVAPSSLDALWNQRLRWFAGWLHNTLNVHRDLLGKKCLLSLLLWYCYIFDYGGAFVDLAALCTFPLLFWFAPDRVFFVAGILVFIPYGLAVGITFQALALKYTYGQHNYRALLFYTWFYPIVHLINMLARIVSSFKYLKGDNGSWHKT